jgi:hypothetical protein
VRLRRNELDEAEGLCAKGLALVSETESRVSRLWLGPLYIEVLKALYERAKEAGELAKAASKLAEARDHLERYSKLVAACQSPRFSREAARWDTILGQSD